MDIISNGLDGSTGAYLLPPMPLTRFARRIRDVVLDQPASRTIQSRFDPRDLGDSGWGIVLPEGADPALRSALAPLIELRRSQATARDSRRFQTLTYLPGETKLKFLARHGAGPGPVDPRSVPYYLLIIGEPEAIPFSLQYNLGMQYAVGRLCFDQLEDYRRYAEQVVAAESNPPARHRQATFFGVQNNDDPGTESSIRHLVEPLTAELSESSPEWRLSSVLRDQATKDRLADLLHQRPPALLFTAGHAVGFASGSGRQRPHQGALLCADWPGPRAWKGRIPEDHYFAADDLASDAQLHGMVSLHFACFSAGTPRRDSFPQQPGPGGGDIAPGEFVARLPQRLLSRGALAVIGHVDRAWHHSFQWRGAGSQMQVFASVWQDLMAGAPVGLAASHFGQRYAEIAADLLFARIDGGDEAFGEMDQVRLWTACTDARGYIVLGDPAARIVAGNDREA